MKVQADLSKAQRSKLQRRLRTDRPAKGLAPNPQKPKSRFGQNIKCEKGDRDPQVAMGPGKTRRLRGRIWLISNSVKLPAGVTEREVSALTTILRGQRPYTIYKE